MDAKDSVPGVIKGTCIPSVVDSDNDIGPAVDLGIKYMIRPEGIALDSVSM